MNPIYERHCQKNKLMNIKHFPLLFLTSLMLAGCDKQISTPSCSSTDTQRLIAEHLTEQAAKLTADKKYDYYDGSFVFGGIKIRESLAQLQIALENINTLKDNDKLCSGLLKVTVPTAMLADANQAREIQHEPKIAVYAGQFNIENSANVFSQNIEYKIQPAGEGKKTQHVEIDDAGWANLLDQIITFALLKPTLELDVDRVQLNEQPKQDVGRLKSEANQAEPEIEQEKSEDDKLRAALQKQGLEKLNKELLEAEQAEKEMRQERASQQAVTQRVPAITTTKQISPSFDCSKAVKSTEITICTHSDLAVLDVKNMELYVKAKSIDAVATKEIWRESIKSKYACGTDVDCIKEVYNKSIQQYGCVGDGNAADCGVDTVDQ